MQHLLIVISLLYSLSMFANDFTINADAENTLNQILFKNIDKKYPKLYEKLAKLKVMKARASNDKKEIVFLFVSESVPLSSIKKFIIESSVLKMEYGVNIALVLQGFNRRAYVKKIINLNEKLSEYRDGQIFIDNVITIYDPKIYKKLNIKKVPAIAFGTYTKDAYPSDSDIKYLIRGDVSLGFFFKQLKKDNKKYENYFYSISSLY